MAGLTRSARTARPAGTRRVLAAAAATLLLLPAGASGAELTLPPGFTATTYVTGEGFSGTVPGIPSTSTMAFDDAGILYLARTGRRYGGGEGEDLQALYRIAPGGGRLSPPTEAQHLHGPPLRNPQVAAIRGGREVLVTTFDRDRKVGVLYRMADGRAELLAGGTPPPGQPAVLKQPEGAATDSAGNLYVADREAGTVVRLDAGGRLLDPRWVTVTRPRVLAMDDTDHLWIGADGEASAPWQPGPGEIWRVGKDGGPSLVLRGPVPAAIALSPGGHLFVADRQGAQVFAVTAEGKRLDVVRFPQGAAPRGLAFAPVTPATRRAGIAGDLFVVTISAATFQVNEVVRITGPFDDLLRPR